VRVGRLSRRRRRSASRRLRFGERWEGGVSRFLFVLYARLYSFHRFCHFMRRACIPRLANYLMTTSMKAVPRQPRQVAGDAGRRLPSSFAFIYLHTISCRIHSIRQRVHRPGRALSHQQALIHSIRQPRPPARSHSPRRPVSRQTIRVQVKLPPPHSPIWMSPSQTSLLLLIHRLLVRILSRPVHSEWISQDHPRYPIDSIMIDHRSNSR
jgi:hypothetical protein